ncbi:MAG: hypothetical protein CSA65_05630 [Proteobacteria bacterium]|nr:MAG: hypothetical protein CSB49_01960 [Pseudomonadota bacterium]PIE18198.1 MAG: hypothetical protein CSA65_05630 [Pseudomonadota bacterium]
MSSPSPIRFISPSLCQVSLSTLLVVTTLACGGPPAPASRPSEPVVVAPPPLSPLDLREAVLATLVVPRSREVIARLSGYARPLRRLPLLGRVFSPAGLARGLFRGLAPLLDLDRPVALALIDERRGRRFSWRDQLVIALPLREPSGKALIAALRRRYPQRVALGPRGVRFGDPRGAALWLQISRGGWAFVARRPRLHRGAASALRPLLATAPKVLRLVVRADRVGASFPTARALAAGLLRARAQGRGGLQRLVARALGLPTLAAVVTQVQDAELEFDLRADGIRVAATLRGGAALARLRRLAAVGHAWGAELLPSSLPLLVASHGDRLERGRALARLVQPVVPAGARATARKLAAELAASLGPGRSTAYGAPRGQLAAAGVVSVVDPAQAQRALTALARLLARHLPSWLVGRPRPTARPTRFRVGRGRFSAIALALPATAQARRALLGPRPCLAFGVLRGTLLWAAGPRCRAEVRALAIGHAAATRRQTPPKGSRVASALRAHLGAVKVSQGFALSLAAAARQALPIAAARGLLSSQTGALARMLVPPPGSERELIVVGRWRPVGSTVRVRLQLPVDVLELGAQVAALMLRIGSYGRRR